MRIQHSRTPALRLLLPGLLFLATGLLLCMAAQPLPAQGQFDSPLAPPNDNFENATQIGAIPFSESVDVAGATVEPGESPPSCALSYPTDWRTIWYRYAPSESGTLTMLVRNSSGYIHHAVGVYTGDSLAGLVPISCGFFYPWGATPSAISVSAGQTYYFQVWSQEADVVNFSLELPGPPSANIDYYPLDAAKTDSISFYANLYDPAGVGFDYSNCQWDFGDGVTAAGCYVSHAYAVDGDFTVQLSASTYDGRLATATRVVTVRTQDVSIVKVSVPQSARAGQTRQIVVGLTNAYYPVQVRLELWKSATMYGDELVGTLVQTVPVRNGNRTVDFQFSYTFTPQDAEVGKVTFKAYANVMAGRDFYPSDNYYVSLPTKVNGASVRSSDAGETEVDGPATDLYLPVIANN